jgi:hypothetical protein
MAIAGKTVYMRGAFIAAFTSEKQWIKTIQKSLFRNWQLIPNIFIAHLPIPVRCKTKGEVGAVCARYCAIGNSVPETGKNPLE